MDARLGRELLFPMLKASVNAALQHVERGPDGVWHLPETISPEFPKTAPDTNYDLSLLRWGCQTLLDLDARFAFGDAQPPLSAGTRWLHDRPWRALRRLPPSLMSSLLGKGDDAVKFHDALIGGFVHPNTM